MVEEHHEDRAFVEIGAGTSAGFCESSEICEHWRDMYEMCNAIFQARERY